MTPIPLTDCCAMLGIDPKTLRHWLRHANMPFVAHPTDARLKCLTEAQVQQLATLHGRPLPSPVSAIPAPRAEPASRWLHLRGRVHPRRNVLRPWSRLPVPCPSLCQQRRIGGALLASLATKVTTLQEQLTQLALELLHERELRYEQRLSALERLVHQPGKPYPAPQGFQGTNRGGGPSVKASPERRLLPSELKARSRVIPLIEYGAQGLYVAVCPHEGVLPFAAESTEWFEWLATLTSFRFVGQQGRLTAYREVNRGRRTRSWTAHRCFHKHHYRYWLGVTDRLTIASLEQTAAKLQADVDAL